MKTKILVAIGLIGVAFLIYIITNDINKVGDMKQIEGLSIINDSGEFDQEAETKANFTILLTNQSFSRPSIELTVYVDGIQIVNQTCDVGMQHTAYNYYYELQGNHQVIVKSEDGDELIRNISVDASQPSWHVISYTNEEADGVKLTYEVMKSPAAWL